MQGVKGLMGNNFLGRQRLCGECHFCGGVVLLLWLLTSADNSARGVVVVNLLLFLVLWLLISKVGGVADFIGRGQKFLPQAIQIFKQTCLHGVTG